MKLLALNELVENEARSVRIPGREVILVLRDGTVYAWENTCPHLGINLEFQPDQFMDADQHFLLCHNHGALFEVETGHCVSGPCQGERLTSIPIRIDDGDIVWVNPS